MISRRGPGNEKTFYSEQDPLFVDFVLVVVRCSLTEAAVKAEGVD
jgi:hypothetical protein